ncbi:MAG: Gfo/Idh/MocA family oxidoreductase [Planctomycetota bacterium]|nr:Gfo/Idh/MocA family oxidoreductase [Planctomycetota bacterium]
MSRNAKSSRRSFLKRAAAVGGAVFGAPYFIPASALGADGATAPSNRIVMGAIGIGNQGSGDLSNFLGFNEVQMVAISDVKKPVAQKAKSQCDGRYKNADCKTYNDARELLERPDIEAVMMAVPDHWHGLMAITACKMGKDVYCEKPLSLTIKDGRAMVNTARRYGRVVSCGSQRVWGDYGRLAQIVRSGVIGDIKEAFVSTGAPSGPCFLPAEPVPEGFDYDMWLGPAPWGPYNPGRVSGAYSGVGWRVFDDYSGGQTTDWGAHKWGGVLFALQLDRTGPSEIIPPGKDSKGVTMVYANGMRLIHSGGGDMVYKGTKGEVSGGNQDKFRQVDYNIPNYKGRGGIYGDFLYCVRSRERCFQDFEVAHRTATVCHLINLCYRFNRVLKYDPVKEEIIGDPEANRWMDRPKRSPWRR